MLSKIKTLFYDRKRSEEEYKIVIRVLLRMNHLNSSYLPLGDFKDKRAFDYNDLSKIPDMYWSIKNENEVLKEQLQNYKEQAADVSSVIDAILDTVEKRYDLTKAEEHETQIQI